MGYVIQVEIQNQYSHVWFERLAEYLKNDQSISISNVKSEIDSVQHIYNITLEVHYKSESIVVCGFKIDDQCNVEIRPSKFRQNGTELDILLEAVMKGLDPMIEDSHLVPQHSMKVAHKMICFLLLFLLSLCFTIFIVVFGFI